MKLLGIFLFIHLEGLNSLLLRFRPSFIFQYITVIASLITAIALAFRKLHSYTAEEAKLCSIIGKANFNGYGIAKLTTCIFLSLKTSIPFVVMNAQSRMVKWLTGVFLTGYLTVIMSYLGFGSEGVDTMGNCTILTPPAVNVGFTVVDMVSSAILLILFLIPVRHNIKYQGMTSTMSDKNQPKTTLNDTLKENIILGVSAGLSLTVVSIFTYAC